MGGEAPFAWLAACTGFRGVKGVEIGDEEGFALLLEHVARTYGLTPSKAAKEPYWVLTHMVDVSVVERLAAAEQPAAGGWEDEEGY